MTTWIVQDNLRQVNDGVDNLLKSLETQKVAFELVTVIPFAEDPPEVKATGPVVFFGSTSLRALAMKSDRKPGVWFNEVDFSFAKSKNGYGQHLLNYDSTVVTVDTFLNGVATLPADEEVFLRPANDSKEVVGAVKLRSEWASELRSSMGVRYGVTNETVVQIAKPKVIGREWRFFIIDRKISTYCQSRENGRLNLQLGAPENVIRFVNERLSEYTPQPVFVMDVCEIDGPKGKPIYKLVENNCFNCSGAYLCDMDKVVRAIGPYVGRVYG